MRLIDADALKKNMGVAEAVKYGNKTEKERQYSYNTLMRYEIADAIDDALTIDAALVVHARWERSQYDRTDRICSACHGIVCGWHEFADCTYEFCPWCGAKMDEKETEE